MTRFTTSNLKLESRGEYLMYTDAAGKQHFVARFKHVKHGGRFARFLRKHFTVEEYFAAYAAGTPPLTIIEAKGYVHPMTRAR
jgi:hypothetical protein